MDGAQCQQKSGHNSEKTYFERFHGPLSLARLRGIVILS
jgi:hypothetical protein